nr:NADH dehydrogenase subunit 2 [Polylepion russelli]
MSPVVLSILASSLGLGTMITFASSNWFLAWMGLEMNTLAILPLMTKLSHPRAVEAAVKYFLMQATAAATFLFACVSNAWICGEWSTDFTSHPFPLTLATFSLAMKIGLAPLHAWVPEILQGLDLPTGLIIATWQKLAPFILLLQLHQTNVGILIGIGLLSTLAGGWGGMNQTQLRKILAYSSIAHLGWTILVLPFSPTLAILTLLTYFIMTFSTFLVFTLNKATSVNALATSWMKAPSIACLTPIILLSLAGLPPLTGFMPKWLILQELTSQGLAFTAIFAALSSLLSLYFYLRISYAITLTMFPNSFPATIPWRLTSLMSSLPLSLFVIATIAFMPLMPAILALLSR